MVSSDLCMAVTWPDPAAALGSAGLWGQSEWLVIPKCQGGGSAQAGVGQWQALGHSFRCWASFPSLSRCSLTQLVVAASVHNLSPSSYFCCL